jgi:hypothetical protein
VGGGDWHQRVGWGRDTQRREDSTMCRHAAKCREPGGSRASRSPGPPRAGRDRCRAAAAAAAPAPAPPAAILASVVICVGFAAGTNYSKESKFRKLNAAKDDIAVGCRGRGRRCIRLGWSAGRAGGNRS